MTVSGSFSPSGGQKGQERSDEELVVSSPSGVAHYYHVVYRSARTLCGKQVPQHRGWFGPIDRPATCTACLRRAGEQR